MGIFHHAVRADFAVVTDHAVFNHTASADFDAVAQRDVTFQDNVSIYFNVAPVGQRATQIETRRIAQHNAREQQLFCLLGLVNTLKTGKLETVVYPVRFADTRRMNGSNLTPFLVSHRNDVGDVVFTLRVVIVESGQPALHIRTVRNQDAGVDLLNLALFVSGIFMLNNPRHVAVFTRNAAIAGWIVQHDGQQTDATLRFGFTQPSKGFNGDQRDVAVEHQDIFIISEEGCSLLHCMTRTQLFCLKHPVEIVVTQRFFQQIAAMSINQMHLAGA